MSLTTKPLIETHWMIKRPGKKIGLYYGSYATRSEAIRGHIKSIGGTWKQAYRRGDRAVRVTIVEDFLSVVKYYNIDGSQS